MQSTPSPKQIDDPHDFVVVPPDLVRVAPADDELAHLVRDLARHPSTPQTRARSDAEAGAAEPQVDTTFRPTAVGGVPAPHRGLSIGRRTARAFVGLLLAICIGVGTSLWSSHGDAAQAMIAAWIPELGLTSWLPLKKLGLSAHPTPNVVEAAATNAEPPQGTTIGQAAPEGIAANAAASSAETSPSLESMARDLANVSQEVVQLRASIEQLKVSQQQTSRDVVKVSEQNKASEPTARVRLSALPPRPAVPRPRKPIPSFSPQAYPSSQAATAPALPQAAVPSVPRQSEPLPPAAAPPPADPEISSVPRPPMPVR
ncbi:MAG TPA: hypothetical protein VFH41_06345 [Bradyrhizobium sp.]|nr:hypothetical protein [Bradyrhizobium sp.]